MSRRAGMFGAEAGLVRMGSSGGKIILTTNAASASSGPTCQEAKAWRNWTFTLEGTFTNYSVLIQGTNDPLTAAGLANNWFTIPALAAQSGTGVEANPLISAAQSLSYDKPLTAVQAVATGNSQTGTVSVRVAASP